MATREEGPVTCVTGPPPVGAARIATALIKPKKMRNVNFVDRENLREYSL